VSSRIREGLISESVVSSRNEKGELEDSVELN